MQVIQSSNFFLFYFISFILEKKKSARYASQGKNHILSVSLPCKWEQRLEITAEVPGHEKMKMYY